MLPITVMPNVTLRRSVDGADSVMFSRTRAKQVKPYSLNAPYYVRLTRTHSASGSGYGWGDTFGGLANANTGKSYPESLRYATPPDFADEVFVQMMNKTRSKFINKMSASAETLVNLAERKQAMTMMTNRVTQLYSFAKRLNKFDLFGAASELGLSFPPRAVDRVERSLRRRQRARTFANVWLEFHFGWEPLVKDIYSAAELLDQPFKPGPIKAGVHLPHSIRVVRKAGAYNDWAGGDFTTYTHTGFRHTRIQAMMRITNPNLYLLQKTGMLNPATVAWELVPFSFVVDWFVNVGDYLQQFTEGLGVDLVDACYSYRWKDECASVKEFENWMPYAPPPLTGFQSIVSSDSAYQRVLGFPNVRLRTRLPWNLSPSRGLTAISLLIQQGIGANPDRPIRTPPSYRAKRWKGYD